MQRVQAAAVETTQDEGDAKRGQNFGTICIMANDTPFLLLPSASPKLPSQTFCMSGSSSSSWLGPKGSKTCPLQGGATAQRKGPSLVCRKCIIQVRAMRDVMCDVILGAWPSSGVLCALKSCPTAGKGCLSRMPCSTREHCQVT